MAAKKQAEPKMSKEEQIGFHKGALQTLAGERNELVKMIQITEGLMQAHVQELGKLGVNLQPPAEDTGKGAKGGGSLDKRIG